MYTEKTDRQEQDRTLYIQTLGIVQMTWGGARKLFSLHTSVTGKTFQLFLLLAYAGPRGVSRSFLQDALYDRKTTDAANALRINATRLRKLLMQSELADHVRHTYVVVEKDTYYLTEPEEMKNFQLDAALMEKFWEQSGKETDIFAKRELLEQACRLYKGEFCPALSGEAWVENVRGHCQELYFKCVQSLCRILKQQRDYENLVKITEEAMHVYPTEEWAKLKMDGFVGLQKYKDAVETYKDAVNDIFLEQGMAVSKNMQEKFYSLRRHMEEQPRNLENIKEWLCEKERTLGAYCCSYPGFIDCYRMAARAAERKEHSGMLMICTIRSHQGAVIKEAEKLREYMDKLDRCVCLNLRREDVYTRYSREQILVLVNNLKPEKTVPVENRIIAAFRKECQGKAEVRIESISLKAWVEQSKEQTKELPKTEKKRKKRNEKAGSEEAVVPGT